MPKVFIIDDDMTMVYLLRTLLEMDGYEVAEVQDWDTIIETVQTESPDLLLMDYFLPDLDGLELLTQLRTDTLLTETRIIMSSGMDVSDQCMAAGADAFLLKPYTPEQLIETIKETIGESRAG